MIEATGGREPQGTGLDRLAGQRAHLRNVLGRRRLAGCSTIAHDEHAQGGVWHLGGDVHVELPLRQAIHVIGKARPVPRQAGGHDDLGDVLHPLHQLHQSLSILWFARREPDPAVAHDDRGDAVGGGRSEPVGPGHVPVVVRVDVHESGGHEPTGAVDLLRSRPVDLAHGRDHASANGHIADEARSAAAVDDGAVPHYQVIGLAHLPMPSVDPTGSLLVRVDSEMPPRTLVNAP